MEDLKPKNSKAKLVMFGDYDTDGSKTYVEDPYYVSLRFDNHHFDLPVLCSSRPVKNVIFSNKIKFQQRS